MSKRLLGRVLFVVMIVVALGGCACNQQAKMDEAMAVQATPPPATVQQAPRPPAPAYQAPPVKKDRN